MSVAIRAALSLFLVPAVAAAADDPTAGLLKTAGKLYDGVTVETLPNGLRVYLKPIPGSATVTTMVAYKVGSADEELTATGLSHYLEHLMFKGTDKIKPGDIDRVTLRNGGHNNAYTSEDMTVYHFDFAADRWAAALDIEADRMRNLRIDAKHEFEQEKGAVINELHGNEDEPWDLEQKAILPMLFGAKAPYGHPVIGEKQHVKGATAAVIKAHYDRWYHPNNASSSSSAASTRRTPRPRSSSCSATSRLASCPKRRPAVEPPERKATDVIKFASKFPVPRLLVGFNSVTARRPRRLGPGRGLRRSCPAARRADCTASSSRGTSSARRPRRSTPPAATPAGSPFRRSCSSRNSTRSKRRWPRKSPSSPPTARRDAEMSRARRSSMAQAIFRQEGVHALAD